MKILSIGECMVELAPAGEAGLYQLGFAGDTFNTSWYLRALRPDRTTSFFTRIGTDALSDEFLDRMRAAGIGTDHVARMPDRTLGLYLISLTEGERSFSYWRDSSAARALADREAELSAAMAAHDLLYFSGITLAILGEAGRARLLAALSAARAGGKKVAFDPNLRPRLWQSEAEMTDAVMDAAAVSDIVLPSFEDEAVHFGDADKAATVARYASAGCDVIVVKDGAAPILYRSGGEDGEQGIDPVADILDTTAAGDSFNAGYLATEGQDLPMTARLRRAAKVSGQVVQGKGALVPLDLAALDR